MIVDRKDEGEGGQMNDEASSAHEAVTGGDQARLVLVAWI